MLKNVTKLYFAGLIFFALLFTLGSVGAQQAAARKFNPKPQAAQ